MITDVLNYRLLSEPALYEAVVKHKNALKWATLCDKYVGEKVDPTNAWEILDATLHYAEAYGKLPGRKALLEFCQSSNDFFLSRRAEIIGPDLKALSDVPVEERNAYSDIDVLITGVVLEARKLFHMDIASRYFRDVQQGPKPAKKGEEPGGIEGGVARVQKMWGRDLEVDSQVGGLWHENMDVVEKRLDDYLNSDENNAILTGFKKIDDAWLISPKYERCLGILGSTGEGKTLFLKSLIYNIAKQGKNILYITLEVDVETMWEQLAFIYAGVEHGEEFTLPSIQKWLHNKKMKTVRPEDRANMQKAIEAIRRREKIPGLIDVQRIPSWDGILAYLTTNNHKNKYDVLVIDYIARLALPKGFKAEYRNEYYNEVCRKAFQLSRTFDNNRGLIVISPAQPTKDGHRKAGDDEAGGYTLDDLSYLSFMRMDWDVIMSVYSGDDDKENYQMRVKCLKQGRVSSMWGAHIVKVDRASLYVHDMVFKPEATIPASIEEPEAAKKWREQNPPTSEEIRVPNPEEVM